MYTKQEIIIRSHREGKSQRTISRELSISRKTIRKYISEYERLLSKKGGTEVLLAQYLSEDPVYQSGVRASRKLTEEVQAAIDRFLKDNEEKKQKGMAKQMLKKCDIHEQLIASGFDIGYTTVCNYIAGKSAVLIKKEAFIRQQYHPGESCEFDWGEVKIYIKDELLCFQLAVFSSAYSNYRYAILYPSQDTLAFLDAHVCFFDFTGGAFRQMIYDNMRVAVAKFVGKHEKEPTRALLQLRGHYRFSHRFCNIRRGNEKGHVERSVEYVRRKAFGVKCRFESVEEANNWLLFTIGKLNATRQTLSGKTANELFEEEKPLLISVPFKMACTEEEQLRVDKYATITYRTNRYSVPDSLVGDFISAKISSNHIRVFKDGRQQASHNRSYGKHQWIIAIDHYLETFKRKPGALAGSAALASCSYLKQLYINYFNDAPRDFIGLLDYCYKNDIADNQIEKAILRLQQSGVREITAEKLTVLLGNQPVLITPDPFNQITQLAKKQLLEQAALMN